MASLTTQRALAPVTARVHLGGGVPSSCSAWGCSQAQPGGTALTAATYVDKLLAIVLDADPWLLDHIQVGAGDGQRRVSAAENQETPD